MPTNDVDLLDQLRRAGWSIGDVALRDRPGGLVWLVSRQEWREPPRDPQGDVSPRPGDALSSKRRRSGCSAGRAKGSAAANWDIIPHDGPIPQQEQADHKYGSPLQGRHKEHRQPLGHPVLPINVIPIAVQAEQAYAPCREDDGDGKQEPRDTRLALLPPDKKPEQEYGPRTKAAMSPSPGPGPALVVRPSTRAMAEAKKQTAHVIRGTIVVPSLRDVERAR